MNYTQNFIIKYMSKVKYIISIGISYKYQVYVFRCHGFMLTYLQRYCEFCNNCPLQAKTV